MKKTLAYIKAKAGITTKLSMIWSRFTRKYFVRQARLRQSLKLQYCCVTNSSLPKTHGLKARSEWKWDCLDAQTIEVNTGALKPGSPWASTKHKDSWGLDGTAKHKTVVPLCAQLLRNSRNALASASLRQNMQQSPWPFPWIKDKWWMRQLGGWCLYWLGLIEKFSLANS